ncbi:hypothetical protein Plav_1486 [Parvibaculum lavamentivorans DS-1]|uniref:Beta-ketoacyl synthase-like N-terminal domain-containing protein n=1 Tax=Parvibaculum lavamentivorans (strain DS-1 / DSM 13023 / NCIMB 13966) TaxID=402881 RepID=A7HT73_PARL1|nr:beta-ketoacyl synthase chain length factor [Parvibaculum lavamentivorans]ABS63106.1 hypothetical protein Plav_1486 [Parvibaculum lavamentivorans DS-1]
MQSDRAMPGPAGLSAVFVESWAAMLADAPGEPPVRLGACAADADIPAGLRRRLGPLARMGVACGLGIAPEGDADIVFCSRYGDLSLAHQLLAALVATEPMSPAGFSMSVHNAVPGVLDLARKARIGHTAIAAGAQTFSAGLAEAWLRLGERPHLRLVLVFADLPLPDIYRQFADEDAGGAAFALRLSAEPGEARAVSITRSAAGDASPAALENPPAELLVRRLVDSLCSDAPALSWRSQGSLWRLGKSSDEAA